MSNIPFNDELVLESWNKNALPWITTIENKEIESRNLVTNQAIIDAIINYSPDSILDMGCGEGWLTRELTIRGIEAWGVDGVSELIEKAQLMNCGKFLVATYEDIINKNHINIPLVDAVVCNFSLLGKETVDNLISTIPDFLKNDKLLFVQTLHPAFGCGEKPYIDEWRQEFWDSFKSQFTQVSPWYFRKLETWIKLLKSWGFSILECREPIHPITREPASIIFIASCK